MIGRKSRVKGADSGGNPRVEQTDEVSLSSRSVFGLGQWAVDGPSGYVVVVLFVDAVGGRRAELKGEGSACMRSFNSKTYLPLCGHLGSSIKHREGAMSLSLILVAPSCPWRLDGAVLALSTLSGFASI